MGLLSRQGAPEWHPADEQVKTACRKAAEFCQAHGIDLSKLAIQYSIANEAIPTTLVGTANPDNLVKNIDWITEPIDRKALEDILTILEPVHNRVWQVGMPENNE